MLLSSFISKWVKQLLKYVGQVVVGEDPLSDMQTCTFQDSKGDKRTLDIHPQTMDENGEGIQDLILETYISFMIDVNGSSYAFTTNQHAKMFATFVHHLVRDDEEENSLCVCVMILSTLKLLKFLVMWH
jgi:hypothetical protein